MMLLHSAPGMMLRQAVLEFQPHPDTALCLPNENENAKPERSLSERPFIPNDEVVQPRFP
jgi:hypothetical protein